MVQELGEQATVTLTQKEDEQKLSFMRKSNEDEQNPYQYYRSKPAEREVTTIASGVPSRTTQRTGHGGLSSLRNETIMEKYTSMRPDYMSASPQRAHNTTVRTPYMHLRARKGVGLSLDPGARR